MYISRTPLNSKNLFFKNILFIFFLSCLHSLSSKASRNGLGPNFETLIPILTPFLDKFAQIIYSKSNLQPMLNQNPKGAQNSLFQLITEQTIAAIQTDTLFLQTHFYINGNKQQEVRATLTSQFIALNEIGWFDQTYHYFVKIDDDIKFQALRERDIGKILGFRLQKTGATSVELTFTKQELSELWIKQMGRLLTQIGFHRMFKPVKKLGKGRFATVYEVQRLKDGQHFAVKVFSKQGRQLTQNQNHRRTLLNEINIMQAVNSPYLMKLEGLFESDNSIYIVIQLISAGQMHCLINRRQGRFSPQEIRQFMAGIARGLTDLHNRGIMHRDIKPQNIMLRREGSLQPVIVDFGLAAFCDADDQVFYRCGTPGYVAPEITTLIKGQKIDPVCDIFSLGAIFNILLVKRPLFQGRGFEQVYEKNRKMCFDLNNPIYKDVDPVAIDLLSCMLRVNPNQRIRASEILQHPFLLGCYGLREESSTRQNF